MADNTVQFDQVYTDKLGYTVELTEPATPASGKVETYTDPASGTLACKDENGKKYQMVPLAVVGDAGKILKNVNGVWTPVTGAPTDVGADAAGTVAIHDANSGAHSTLFGGINSHLADIANGGTYGSLEKAVFDAAITQADASVDNTSGTPASYTGLSTSSRWFMQGSDGAKAKIPAGTLITSVQFECKFNTTGTCDIHVEVWEEIGSTLTRVKDVALTIQPMTPMTVKLCDAVAINYVMLHAGYITIRGSTTSGTYPIATSETGKTGYRIADVSSATLSEASIATLSNYWVQGKINATLRSNNILIKRGFAVVNADRLRDYPTIAAAIAAEEENHEIRISPGVYTECVDASTKSVVMRGVDRNLCVLRYANGLYAYPPLSVTRGYIENLSIIADLDGTSQMVGETTTGAYGVHIEDPYGADGMLRFFNCIFKSYFFPGVGMGTRAGGTVIFDYCYFENAQVAGRGKYSNGASENSGSLGALYFHDPIQTPRAGGAKVIFRNCIFKSSLGNAICIYDQMLAGNSVEVEFIDCRIWDAVHGWSNNIWWRYDGSPAPSGSFAGHMTKSVLSYGNSNAQLNS